MHAMDTPKKQDYLPLGFMDGRNRVGLPLIKRADGVVMTIGSLTREP